MSERLRTMLQHYEKPIGLIASGLAILMFFSLIEIFISNIRGESNILIQPAATALSGFFWSLYGYSKKDWVIMAPNLTALVLGLATVLSAVV